MNTRAWITTLLTSLFFLFEFFQINMFNTLESHLMRSFDVSPQTLGLVSACYFYGTIVLLFPAGIILDKISPKKLLLGALFMSILGTICIACATSIYHMSFGRFMVGFCGGPFGLLAPLKITSLSFPKEKLPFAMGFIVAIGMLGGILSQAPFSTLVIHVGWRDATLLNALMGCIIWVVIALYVKEPTSQAIKSSKTSLGKDIQEVLSNRQINYAGVFASLLNLPVFVLGALWGNIYLISVHELSIHEATYVSTMIYFGMLIGAPLFGQISERVESIKYPMLAGILLTLTSFIGLEVLSICSFYPLCCLFFLMGLGSSAQTLCYPFVASSVPHRLVGTAEGLSAVMIMAAGAIFQPLFGYLMGAQPNAIYTSSDFYLPMMLFPITLGISFLATVTLKHPSEIGFFELERT